MVYCFEVARPSFMFWFQPLILLNNLSEGSLYIAGVSNHCLLTLLVFFFYFSAKIRLDL